jgi:hypothetical protein
VLDERREVRGDALGRDAEAAAFEADRGRDAALAAAGHVVVR